VAADAVVVKAWQVVVPEASTQPGCRTRSLRDRVIALRTRQVALRFVPATSNGRATLSPRARPMARVEFRRSLRDVPC
jgi:hypothetical protein